MHVSQPLLSGLTWNNLQWIAICKGFSAYPLSFNSVKKWRLQWGFKCHRVLQGSRPLTTSFLASTWWFLVLHEWFQKMMSCSERLHVRVWDIYKPFLHVLDLFRGSACSENSQGAKIGVEPKNLNVSCHGTFLVPIKRLLPRIIESSLAMLAVWNMGGVGLEEST